MDRFQHRAIDLDGPAIRLIRLLKGSGSTIECELFDAWLSPADCLMDYAALSYTWGGEEKPREILVNQRRMAVTENLYLALQHVRYLETDRILWVDAICINQMNHLERGHQVGHMASIYRAAERVIIWLGDAADDSDYGMAFAKRVENDSLKYSCDKGTGPTHLLDCLSDGEMFRLYRSLKSLLQRPWFRRVWILQEVANARVAEVICGTKSVSARIFSLVPAFVGIVPDPHSQAVLDIMPGHSRESSWWAQKRDLQTLLLKFGNSEASDPRDHIFALLGISTDACNTDLLKPNYENSIQEVIGETVSFILHFHRTNTPVKFCPDWTLHKFLDSLKSIGESVFDWAVEKRNLTLAMILVVLNHVNWETMPDSGTEFSKLLSRDTVEVPVPDETDGTTTIRIPAAFTVPLRNKLDQAITTRAIQDGHINLVKYLLDSKKVDPNFTDEMRWTPLGYAAMGGHEAIVKLLLDTGKVDVNASDITGWTPLWHAIRGGHHSIVKLLLDTGQVDLDSQDVHKRTPLWHAVYHMREEMVELLLDTGKADVHAEYNLNRSFLWNAAVRGYSKTVLLLLRSGKAHISCDQRALMEAVETRDKAVVEWLLGESHPVVVGL
jgi:Heterokaryon incompatibility protein (HET)/Ankyrin repeats (3 copies)